MTMLDFQMYALDIARGSAGLGVNWFIQSTLLIVAGLWIGAALRANGSAVQSAVYRTTLAAVLVCPIVSWSLAQLGATGWSLKMPDAYLYGVPEVAQAEQQSVPIPVDVEQEPIAAALTEAIEPLGQFDPPGQAALESSSTSSSGDTNFVNDVRQAELDLPPVPIELPSAPAPTFAFNANWFGIAALVAGAVWLLMAGWLLLRLAYSWRQLIRIRRTASAADAATIDTCRNVSKLFHVAPPNVLHSPFLPSPCLAGLHRPAVLLPDAELSLPMRDVLIHELAHLARGDCYWNLLRRTATALLFFQPLMWRLSRRLDSSAEEVCDDYVVQFGGDRREYAHRLVDIAELSVAPIVAAGAGIVSLRSMLAARVARIMDTSRSLSTRVGHALLTLVLLAGLVGTVLVGLVGVEPERAAAEADSEGEAQSDESDQPSEIAVAAGSSSDDEATATGAITSTVQSVDSDASLEPANENGAQPLTKVHGRVVDETGQPVPGALVRVMRKTFRALT
jgi:beta-lactamase regulating signal transducer with metallopeptidase domain